MAEALDMLLQDELAKRRSSEALRQD